MSKAEIVCVSGYFDPIHAGHIEYMKMAKKEGDKLMVIVNNDHQSELKKGSHFMDEKQRLLLVSELDIVDIAVLSIDYDRTVCETLRRYKPDVFANGGDQFNDKIPETPVCNELGIRLVDNLGDKVDSSRWIVRRALSSNFKKEWLGEKYETTERPWGCYKRVIPSESGYQVKIIIIKASKSISLQKHQHRRECWTITSGTGRALIRGDDKNEDKIVKSGDVVDIPAEHVHRMTNVGEVDLEFIEVQTGSYLGEDDIERYRMPDNGNVFGDKLVVSEVYPL